MTDRPGTAARMSDEQQAYTSALRRAQVTCFICLAALGLDVTAFVILMLGDLAAGVAFFIAALVLSSLGARRIRQRRLNDLQTSHGEISAHLRLGR